MQINFNFIMNFNKLKIRRTGSRVALVALAEADGAGDFGGQLVRLAWEMLHLAH